MPTPPNNFMNFHSPEEMRQMFPNQEIYQTPTNTPPPATPTLPPAPPVVAPVVPPPPGPGIVSSTNANNVLQTGGNQLDQMINQPDPYEEYLLNKRNQLMNPSDEPGIDEKNAAVKSARDQKATQDKFNNYQAGLATLGIQTGLSRYAPGLQADKVLQAQNMEDVKLEEIRDRESLAIAKAKQARIDKNSTELKSTLAEIRQLKQDKRQALMDIQNKRTQDITVANSLATHAYKELQNIPNDQKENFILQLAKDNNVSPGAIIAALAKEQDDQTKFQLTTDLQRKALAKSSGSAGGKILTPAVIAQLKKQNPWLDLSYGDDQDTALNLIDTGQNIISQVKNAANNPDLTDDDGFFTAEYIKNVLKNLPSGIGRSGFLESIKDNLYLKKYKFAKDYGISEREFEDLTAE